MANKKPDVVTDDDIAAANEALRVGKERLEQVRELFYEGDGSWDDVKSQEAVVEYAEAAIERLQRAKSRYDKEVRAAALTALRADVEAWAEAHNPKAVEALKGVETWVRAYGAAIVESNSKIGEFIERAQALDVPAPDRSVLAPRAVHGGIAQNGSSIQVGDLMLEKIHGAPFIQQLFAFLITSGGISKDHFYTNEIGGASMAPDSVEQIYERLGSAESTRSSVSREGVFYRGYGGGVHQFSEPFSPAEAKRRELKQISVAEAFGEEE
ncbi:hypothetical protein GCM10027568_11010 [Humibacter soli]